MLIASISIVLISISVMTHIYCWRKAFNEGFEKAAEKALLAVNQHEKHTEYLVAGCIECHRKSRVHMMFTTFTEDLRQYNPKKWR